MKKIFFICLLLFSLCACGTKETSSDKIELEFWTLQLASYKDYIEALIDEYESTHPDIKIKWLDVPFKEGEKRSLAAAMSNKVPDVINLNPIFSSTLASKKALVNFNDYVTENERNLYLPAAWQACSLGDFTFGIPWYITSSITIYNEQELKQAGYYEPPKTYSQLMEYSKALKDSTGHYAFLPTISDGDFFLKLLVKNGVPIKSKTSDKVVLNDSRALSTLNEWINLYKNNYISPESIVSNHQEAVDKFQSGVTTFIVIGPNFIKNIKENSPKLFEKINVSPQIVGETGKVDFSVMNFIVPIKSKHKREAVEFTLFLTNYKNQLAFSKLTPTLPSNVKALNDDFFKVYDESNIEQKGRMISAKQLLDGAVAMPVFQNQQELIAILNYYVQKALLSKISSKEALDTINNKWNKILSE
ncbi:MAG: ABC transporter substrate-binding protein [Vampirovibrionia bacterium]